MITDVVGSFDIAKRYPYALIVNRLSILSLL